MVEVFTWIMSHWQEIVAIIPALIAIATVVTAFTKTPKDDAWVRRIAGWLSFLTHKDTTGTVKMPGTSAPRVEPPLMAERTKLWGGDSPSPGSRSER